MILRFDNDQHLRRWIDSDARKDYITRVHPLLADSDKVSIETGLEYWFTAPGSTQRSVKPYKQPLVTFSAIFPPVVAVPWALQPLLESAIHTQNQIGEKAVTTAVIVWLMTYIVMPRYTRAIFRWLFA